MKKNVISNDFVSLLKKRTAWFFLIPAFNDENDRHLKDLMFGIDAIVSRGIKKEDIYLFLDIEPQLESNLSEYLISKKNNLTFIKHGNLTNFINLDNEIYKSYENTVFFVLGHGSPLGLETSSGDFLTPHNLINKIQNNDYIKNSVLFLGQCYSGVFNYLKVKNDNPLKNQLTIIGGSDLQISLSHTIHYNGDSWVGNLFYLHLFNWFFDPKDIDGDKYFSILDAYKYTGALMYEHIKSATDKCLPKYITLHNSKDKLIENLKINITKKVDIENKLSSLNNNEKEKLMEELNNIMKNEKELIIKINKLEEDMNSLLSYFGSKQDVWVLNANHARVIGL